MKPTTSLFSQKTVASEVGSLAQLMPSWVRACCRSRLDYDEDELLDHMKKENIKKLEASKYRDRFTFIDYHIDLLGVMTPDRIRKVIRKKQKLGCNPGPGFCRYEFDGKKRLCWSCPRVREIINELGGMNGKERFSDGRS